PEPDLLPAELPALARDRAAKLPATAAVLVRPREEFTVRVPFGSSGGPHRLRFRPDEAVAAVALELASMPRIDEAVIGPGLRDHVLDELRRRRRFAPGGRRVGVE